MKRTAAFLVAGAVALCATISNAAPPAPVTEPPELVQPIGGYDLRPLYQLWRRWIESRKGEVVQALLEQPDEIADERASSPEIVSFTLTNDFGVFAAGDIRRYCRIDRANPSDVTDCHYLYRRAFVPHEAGASGEPNPLTRWMRASFDAQGLAAHLRYAQFPPNTNWWFTEPAILFSTLPSPVPMLRENAVVRRWDSRNCPQLAAAITGLETQRIDWPVDLFGVGEDRFDAPPPHGVSAEYRLTLIVPGRGGIVRLSGSSEAFQELTRPIWAAVERCDRREREAASAGD